MTDPQIQEGAHSAPASPAQADAVAQTDPVETPAPTAPAVTGPSAADIAAELFKLQVAAGYVSPQIGVAPPVAAPEEHPDITRANVANDPNGQNYVTPSGGTIAVKDGDTVFTEASGTQRSVSGDIHDTAVKIAHLFGL